MEEVEGFEPPRGLTRLSVFKTDPFSRTWVYLRLTSNNISHTEIEVNKIPREIILSWNFVDVCHLSFRNNLSISHIRTKNLRYEHSAILLLIIFQDGCNGSSNG